MIAKSLLEWIDAGLRQAGLAKTASLSLGTISNVERGEGVSFDRIISLLRVLGGLRGLDAILALCFPTT
ncbi:MAG: helix-turn-helix transcriptional regulator [Bacilli bacterium]|jgi:transcriptional regulator with XRE-family HTH domain|nr:helix-turn-helix transcriptional regulator [Bacilli bacterium]